jgi:hypothetical protein
MMEKTALGSESNCAAHAWSNQATGAPLPNGSFRSKSEVQISFQRPHHRSLQLPRSHKRSHALNTSGSSRSSPEIQPTIKTHRPPAGQRLTRRSHLYAFRASPAATPV